MRATNRRPSLFRSVSKRVSVTSGLEDTKFVEKIPNPTTPPIPEYNLPDNESELLRPLK